MKDQHDVRSHTLVGNDDLFTTVDYKVPSLIENALLGVLSDLFVIQASELTEVRSDHNGDLA